ncbi:MAG: hypothetical protein QM784_16605 [Polyangiaceae bacterium]
METRKSDALLWRSEPGSAQACAGVATRRGKDRLAPLHRARTYSRGLLSGFVVAGTSLCAHGEALGAKTDATSQRSSTPKGASSAEVSGVHVERERGTISTEGAAEPETNTGESRLPPLPTPPNLVPPPPDAADVEELDGKLARLKSADAEARNDAARELLEVRPRLVSAVLARLGKLSERADRERMKRALAAAKERLTRSKKAAADDADVPSDMFLVLVRQASPKDEGWKDLVELFAISRMFAQIGTVEAARGLVEIYVRFGEFVRVDVQNRLGDLKDGAIAALVEARRHKAEKIAQWAERQLDRIGKGGTRRGHSYCQLRTSSGHSPRFWAYEGSDRGAHHRLVRQQ